MGNLGRSEIVKSERRIWGSVGACGSPRDAFHVV